MTWILSAIVVTAAVYMFLIMPRIFRRPSYQMFEKQPFYAHRGLHDNQSEAPENSMEAFRLAAEAGYGIELDLQLTKDRVLVVFHDDNLRRACGVSGRVKAYTYQELQQFSLFHSDQKIPKFEDVLALVNGRVPLIVEHKIEWRHSMAVCRQAAKLLDRYQGEYCMESFHPLGLFWYRRHRRKVIRGQLAQLFHKHGKSRPFSMRPMYFCMGHLLFDFLTRPDFIAYDCRDYKEWSRRLCRSFYKIPAVAWTVRSPAQLEEIRPYFDIFIFEGFRP